MIFLDEKPRFTFANFLHLFIQGPPLTHSAMVGDVFGDSGKPCWVMVMGDPRPGDINQLVAPVTNQHQGG